MVHMRQSRLRFQASMAHTRQSRPVSGPGFEVEDLETFQVCLPSLDSSHHHTSAERRVEVDTQGPWYAPVKFCVKTTPFHQIGHVTRPTETELVHFSTSDHLLHPP